MEIEAAIQQTLLVDPGLSLLIGTRLYPQEGQQSDTLPLVTYESTDPDQLFSVFGPMNSYTVQMVFQVQAATYQSAREVAAAIRNVFWPGGNTCLKGDIAGGDITISGVFPGGGDDSFEPPLAAGQKGVNQTSVIVRIRFGKA